MAKQDLTLTVTVPAEHADRVIEAFCAERWTPTIAGELPPDAEPGTEAPRIPNPQTKEMLVTQKMADWVNQVTSDYEQAQHLKQLETAAQNRTAPVPT